MVILKKTILKYCNPPRIINNTPIPPKIPQKYPIPKSVSNPQDNILNAAMKIDMEIKNRPQENNSILIVKNRI